MWLTDALAVDGRPLSIRVTFYRVSLIASRVEPIVFVASIAEKAAKVALVWCLMSSIDQPLSLSLSFSCYDEALNLYLKISSEWK